MSTGFELCQYIDDNGTPWRLMVDADYASDPIRGWTVGASPGLYPLPRGWTPRAVIGMAADGRIAFARCGTRTCDLWTGAAAAFFFYDSERVLVEATVIQRKEEYRRH